MNPIGRASARLPFDAVRLLLEETARGGLPTEEPEVVRFLSGVGWRLERALLPGRAAIMAEEAARTFGVNPRTADAAVREAHDVTLQARLEALLIPRMDADQLARVVQVFPNISTLAGPALVVFPHAGNLLALVAALAVRTEGLVVFGARRADGASTSMGRRCLARRLEEEDRLPVRWEEDPDAIPGWFAQGRVVAVAFDDRSFRRYRRVELLGRPALLSPDPWEAAERMGVPVVPAAIRRDRDKVNRVQIGAPRPAELERYVHAEAEPFLRAHPGHYLAFLAECRLRAAEGAPPLFLDGIPEAEARRWLTDPDGID